MSDTTRQQRGLIIAAMFKIDQTADGRWLVPSQSGDGTIYTVDPTAETPTCSCPDHQDRGVKCKHMFAVEFVLRRETTTDAETGETTTTVTQQITVLERVTYKQNWRAYDMAQTNEKEWFQILLRDLCRGVPEPPRKPGAGRNPHPRAEMIFAIGLKVYSTLSSRRCLGDLKEAHQRGYLSVVPSYNSIVRYLHNPDLTPILKSLVVESAKPLASVESAFAVDSSGFAVSRFDRWFDMKYGKMMEKQEWVKVHIMCGTHTNVVTAVEILDKNAGDAPLLPPLLKTTTENFTVKEVSADSAYSSQANLEAIAGVGATPFVAFKETATGASGGLFEKCFHFYNLYRDKFLQHYHKRSNAESTFSMVKAKFRDHVRAKTDAGMVNEVLCKFLCHNICCLIQSICEMKIEPAFWAEEAGKLIRKAGGISDEPEETMAWEFV